MSEIRKVHRVGSNSLSTLIEGLKKATEDGVSRDASKLIGDSNDGQMGVSGSGSTAPAIITGIGIRISDLGGKK
jgi:hypothetical protein